MSSFWQDLRNSIRVLRRSPGHTLAVVLTLAMGIGGTTAIFSFVNGVLLRPLPYPDPDDLVLVCEVNRDRPSDWCGASPANLWDWRESSRTLQTVGLGRSWSFGLKDEQGKSRNIQGGVATVGMFDALGVEAQFGRLIEESDHQQGQDNIVILSHELWQDRFGSDPTIVGRRVDLDNDPYFVIGVLPAGFEVPYLESVQLWIPLWSDRVIWRTWRGLRPYARLAPGVTLAEARAEMSTIAARLAAEHPEANAQWDIRVDRLQERMVASVRPALLLFLGAVALVLLISCANVANLLLARATAQEREFGLRVALGAGRGRIIRGLLTDSLVLALLGGGAGVLLAMWLIGFFLSLAPAGFPRLDEVRLDSGVLLFTFALSAVTSLLFGLLPAWQSSRVDLNGLLKEGGRTATGSSSRARNALVVAEVALSLVLLVGAGLLLRSFRNLTDWQPGFDTERLVTFSIFPPLGKHDSGEKLGALYRRINTELTALPGVISAGEVSAGPLFGGGDGVTEFAIEGRPVPDEGEFPTVAWFDCGPNYFSTVGIALLRGRYFTDADDAGAPRVAIINDTMARRHWPTEDPVGQRLRLTTYADDAVQIVGVVADVPSFDPREPVQPEIYWPLHQAMRGATFYAVRTELDPSLTLATIRDTVERIEPEMGLGGLATVEERMQRELIRPRFQMLLVGLFSGVAFTIAMLGVYGIISYTMARQAHELGIRRALGAQTHHVLTLVLRKALLLAGTGVALGALGALALTRTLRSMLVEVTPTDPSTFILVALSVVLVSLLASLIPAWRATAIDPMQTLRHD